MLDICNRRLTERGGEKKTRRCVCVYVCEREGQTERKKDEDMCVRERYRKTRRGVCGCVGVCVCV